MTPTTNHSVLCALAWPTAAALLTIAVAAPGCSGSTDTTGASVDGAADGSHEALPEASPEASPEAGTGCSGTAPNCFGSNLSSCCGQDPYGVATCSGGQWMCGAALAPGCNGQGCIAPQDAGASCPASRPAEGSACSTSQLACEYGTDPALECNTVVTCSGGAWTTTQTPFTGGACATTSAPACPASSADVPQQSACGGTFLLCVYPDARCECACPAGNPGGNCSTDASGGPRTWQCDTSSGPAPACPTARPRLGTPCTPENQDCSYAGQGSLACWGDALACRGGVWVNIGGAGC